MKFINRNNNQILFIMRKIILTLLLAVIVTIGFTQELILFKDSNGKYGYKTADGATVVQAKYDLAKPFFKGIAAVYIGKVSEYGDYPELGKDAGVWGFINEKGKEITEIKYEDAMGTSLRLNKKWAVFNIEGKQITEFKYDAVGPFKENYFTVRIGKEYFKLNYDGKLIEKIHH